MTADQKFVCGYRLDFSDDGEPEAKILHEGTLEECERIGNMFPAVSYSGSRPNPRASFVIAPLPSEAS